MFGFRVTMNDAAGSEIFAGVSQDLDSSTRAINIEASRRIGDRIRATLDIGVLSDASEDDFYYSARNDDSLRIELAYYF